MYSKFAKKLTQVLEKYGCSIHKHIEDGVCLPAMDPFLSRHVSRRSFLNDAFFNFTPRAYNCALNRIIAQPPGTVVSV